MRFYAQSPEQGEDAIAKAKAAGLDKIDYESVYKLVKLGAKRPSGKGYPDKMIALLRGTFWLISAKDKGELFVWLYGSWINGEWFKTSPILSCKKVKGGYKIETQNSFYKLEEV